MTVGIKLHWTEINGKKQDGESTLSTNVESDGFADPFKPVSLRTLPQDENAEVYHVICTKCLQQLKQY